jgi:type 1 glutamine amidotransferase
MVFKAWDQIRSPRRKERRMEWERRTGEQRVFENALGHSNFRGLKWGK